MRHMMLLGTDHATFGEYTQRNMGTIFAAISVGADPDSPSKKFKGDPRHLNEDALLVCDDGQRCLMAVADAHFGWQASHQLVTLLGERVKTGLPRAAPELTELIRGLRVARPSRDSASTLLVAVFDQQRGEGFGLSVGDSTLLCVSRRTQQRCSPVNRRYISMAHPASLEIRPQERFTFSAEPGDLLLAFTDGIDECNYRNPGKSIRLQHHRRLITETGPMPQAYGQALMSWALRGVEPHPGGQDNIALIAYAV